MKVVVNRDLLLGQLERCQLIIQKGNNRRPILQNVQLQTLPYEIIIWATDLEKGYKGKIPANIVDSGVFCVNCANLHDAVKAIKIDNVLLLVENRTLIVAANEQIFRLPIFEEILPDVPELQGEKMDISSDMMLETINKVAFCANKDKNRYSLDSVLIALNGDYFEAVATDQVRLAFSRVKSDQTYIEERKIILPIKAINFLQKTLKKTECQFSFDKNTFSAKFNDGHFLTRQVETQFPRYRDAFSNYRDIDNIQVNTADFLRLLSDFSKHKKNCKLSVELNKLTISLNSPIGNFCDSIAYDGQNMNIVCGINPGVILDFFKIHKKKASTINIKICGEKKPLIFFTDTDNLFFVSPCSMD